MQLPEMPPRIASLPQDHRGYPIPWNILLAADGTPFFIVNDDRTHLKALVQSLCPICSEALGRWKWFVGGPGSAFDEHGWYIDLPMHHDCMVFALSACPYLSNPNYQRCSDAIAHAEKLPPEARMLIDETVDPVRPLLFVAVAASRIEVQANGPMLPYVRPVRPALAYEFWQHGKRLMEGEALPLLQSVLGSGWQIPEVAS